jgi:hypothetical protein
VAFGNKTYKLMGLSHAYWSLCSNGFMFSTFYIQILHSCSGNPDWVLKTGNPDCTSVTGSKRVCYPWRSEHSERNGCGYVEVLESSIWRELRAVTGVGSYAMPYLFYPAQTDRQRLARMWAMNGLPPHIDRSAKYCLTDFVTSPFRPIKQTLITITGKQRFFNHGFP